MAVCVPCLVLCYEVKLPNLKLKTRLKQLLGYLLLGIALPGIVGCMQWLQQIWHGQGRETLLKGKAQCSWPPRTNYFRSASFEIENIVYFATKSYLNGEVNRTDPSPSVSVLWIALFIV